MIFPEDEVLVPLFQNCFVTFWNLVTSNIFFTCLTFLTLYLLYKLVTFTEVVANYTEDVPPEVRQLNSNEPEKNSFPPFFPNGWIPILESRAIRVNQVKSVLCLGLEVAVVRGAAGQVYVIDAFCPHLGANFAVGGTVYQQQQKNKISEDFKSLEGNEKSSCKTADDCVRCPFHGWSFRLRDGQCSEVPYEESPMNAKVKVWTSVEVNGYIFVWHHFQGEPPSWELVPVPEIANQQWAYYGRTDHTLFAHPQEILENASDFTHLPEIHATPFLSSNFALLNRFKKWPALFEHRWMAEWTDGPAAHQATVELVNPNVLFGKFTLFTMHITIKLTGPAHVEIFFQSEGFLGRFKGAYMEFVTPVSPLKNRIVYHIWLERTGLWSYLMGKFFLYAMAKMVERDIVIWNRKAFVRRPLATKTEKPLIKYRRWYKQFYSNNSIIDW